MTEESEERYEIEESEERYETVGMGERERKVLSNIPTSNPYDWLSQEFDPENYTRSVGAPNVLDDMESDEEVEVVFDETVNLPNSTKTGVSNYTAQDVSNT
ncbi:hypothetical protein Tco_0920745 [Tanacetum coccineum]